VTVPISQNSVPARIVVAPHDQLTFVSIDSARVHRLSCPSLPGFDTQDLYPEGFPSDKPVRHEFTYDLNGAPEGEYTYGDDYLRQVRGVIVVVNYDNPWNLHPGYPGGPRADIGPTRIIAARVAPTRNNPVANTITPASVTDVLVEVMLSGVGNATLVAKLSAADFAVGPSCADPTMPGGVRVVDASVNPVEQFAIDASSLPDGSLQFELIFNELTYIVPGPVLKQTVGAAFPPNAMKNIVNINLS